MIREILEELILAGSNLSSLNYLSKMLGSGFLMQQFIATFCLGASIGMFFKVNSQERKYLGSEDPNYLYMRNRTFKWKDIIHSLCATPVADLNHISGDFLKNSFLPYTFIDRDDYRLGEAEWSYPDIEATSLLTSTGHINDIKGPDSIEFEYFKKYMRQFCGLFPMEDLKKMFAEAEIIHLEPNEVLMEIGDPDEYVYLVLRGSIELVVVDSEKRLKTLRVATRGDRIHSLFSFIDVLTGHSQPMKTIEAFANEKSKVIKFPVPVIREYLLLHEEKIPDIVCRMIRKIYEMNFVMLHRILGVSLSMAVLGDHQQSWFARMQLKTQQLENDDYVIPDPADGVPDPVRMDAIASFKRYLGVPQSTDLLDECDVFIVDPDERSPEDILDKNPIIDVEKYKFKYLFKGQAELYRINSTEKDDIESEELPIYSHDTLYMLFPGEGVGGLSTFAEVENFLFIRVIRRSIIVATTQGVHKRLFEKFPKAILPMAHQIVSRLAPILRRMDFGIEWTLAEGGKALFITGSEVRDTFVVLGGRLRSYMIDPKGKLSYYAEYERFDWIGLVEAMVAYPIRSKTVIAVRETELCKVPMDFIAFLKTTFPTAAISLLGYIANRVGRYRFHSRSLKLRPENQLITGTSRRCATLGIIPASEEVPYISFAKEIKRHHDVYGMSAVISWLTVKELFNVESINHSMEYIIETWVYGMFSRYDLVIFICSPCSELWTEMCIKHSEVVLTIGVHAKPYGVTKVEQLMFDKGLAAGKRKELIVLHKLEINEREGRYKLPKDTIAWLEPRPWLSVHHHIRIPAEAFKFCGLIHVNEIDQKYKSLTRKIEKHSDLSRFNRWILGKSVGIVFTGGGSRMASQAGVFKAVTEHDIPIDIVGGVGTGFLLAALYSIHGDTDKVVQYAHEMFEGICKASETAVDVTIPYISSIQGRGMLLLVMKYFGRTRMEDTWTPIFGVSCDISKQDSRVHRDGPFWVYTRAALSNFMGAPPICDPHDGGYIVEGSFANPIPGDVMRRFGAEYILVINTTDGKTYDSQKFDPTKDVWTNLWRLFLQLASRLNFATPDFVRINEMIGRTQKVMCAEAVEANTEGLFVSFIKPDSEAFPSSLFLNFHRMRILGQKYAKQILEDCPVTGTPFHEFWLNVRRTSARLETDQGRGIRWSRSRMNEEFWDRMEHRIFERDDKAQDQRIVEIKAKLGKGFRGTILDMDTTGLENLEKVLKRRRDDELNQYNQRSSGQN